jgi:hypothetical protein
MCTFEMQGGALTTPNIKVPLRSTIERHMKRFTFLNEENTHFS